ncbi:hypothetical protein NC99_00310 [Sunxiuqinia dokdonensis]|uniref:Uncharacterized protein n=1 Tax=Sunxiuqinia dokdonensis TaxID=1409788 RepID=A0A0L8VFB2_9BACT|nr:hypothetical protein NC99_00310 [Sunxiuqinia dokdonensis]
MPVLNPLGLFCWLQSKNKESQTQFNKLIGLIGPTDNHS